MNWDITLETWELRQDPGLETQIPESMTQELD